MLLEAMANRRSVRRFAEQPVPRKVIEDLLAAAVLAPSASNKQPWRFLVVTNRRIVRRLVEAVRRAVDRVAAGMDPRARDAFRDYAAGFRAFDAAPVVIVPLWRAVGLLTHLGLGELEAKDRDAIERMEETSGVASVSLAVQNLLLRVHDRGLGATLMTGCLLAREEMREILGVRSSWEILGLLPVGYPAEDPPAPGRKPVEQVVRWMEDDE